MAIGINFDKDDEDFSLFSHWNDEEIDFYKSEYTPVHTEETLENFIRSEYKNFCKDTKRSGGVLVSSSIGEWNKYLSQRLFKFLNKTK